MSVDSNFRRRVAEFNNSMEDASSLEKPLDCERSDELASEITELGQNWDSTHSAEVMGRLLNLYNDICTYGSSFSSAHDYFTESRIIYSEERKTGGLF